MPVKIYHTIFSLKMRVRRHVLYKSILENILKLSETLCKSILQILLQNAFLMTSRHCFEGSTSRLI